MILRTRTRVWDPTCVGPGSSRPPELHPVHASSGPADNPRRYRSRLAAKQVRGRAERARNRREREALRDAERRDHLESRLPF
ncbi:hypothetical protein [Gordonia amicalis]|uniref:hypothetical protein n=1 Tax=Gordonia amicalis TaxID=89053 RepID=UPI0002A632C0|nr:hypothetical protein [Gordonia amicalis]MDV7175732.1 hypothetical protein [Gordonia amicalis]NKX77569.1 hypothetical protein [Gordonia amicalis]GAC52570.1 hypothetical protein GOAMI_13_01200 [Gordonia amicalis NBRC 100051 = JCM 11271]